MHMYCPNKIHIVLLLYKQTFIKYKSNNLEARSITGRHVGSLQINKTGQNMAKEEPRMSLVKTKTRVYMILDVCMPNASYMTFGSP